jgi:putative transposase
LQYTPATGTFENLKTMSLMDTHLLNHPTDGDLQMVDWLREHGYPLGPKRIRRMFKLMGLNNIYAAVDLWSC